VGDVTDATIRRATAADIAALLALYAEFHSFHVAGVPERLREPEQRDDAGVRAALSELLRAEDAALFIAAGGGDQVIGLAEFISSATRRIRGASATPTATCKA